MPRNIALPETDKFFSHLFPLLNLKGYQVLSASVTFSRSGTRIGLKLNPPPPGRGVEKWGTEECTKDAKGARQKWQIIRGTWTLLPNVYERSVCVTTGFRSGSRYINSTPRLSPEKLLHYVNELPWVQE